MGVGRLSLMLELLLEDPAVTVGTCTHHTPCMVASPRPHGWPAQRPEPRRPRHLPCFS